MKLDIFEYTPVDFAAHLTNAAHRTCYHLWKKGTITEEQYNELIGTLIITPIPNRKTIGSKIRSFFFDDKSNEGTWVFPITEIPKHESEKDD